MNVFDAPWPEGRTVVLAGSPGGLGAACPRSFAGAGHVDDTEMMPGHAPTVSSSGWVER